jgi:hypothetical protein
MHSKLDKTRLFDMFKVFSILFNAGVTFLPFYKSIAVPTFKANGKGKTVTGIMSLQN